MSRFERLAILASLSFFGLSLCSEASAQTPKAKDATPARPKPVDVYNHIEGEMTILKLKSDGTVVKKGEWVVELDPTDLQDKLASQKTGLKVAELAYRYAKMNREVAEIGVKEFIDGISKEDIEQADLAVAEAKLKRMDAEKQAKKSKNPNDDLAFLEAKIAEDKAKAKKETLIKYTEAKNVKELESEVFKAKEEELKKEGDWQLEKSRGEKLRKAIEACKVVAPIAGTVGYPRHVEVEDTFRQGDVMFQIFPDAAPKTKSK